MELKVNIFTRKQNGVIVCGWILILAVVFNITYITIDNLKYYTTLSVAAIITMLTSYFMMIQWAQQHIFVISTILTPWHLMRRFTAEFRQNTKTSKNEDVAQIHSYRLLHLQLCDLISSANALLKYNLGLHVVGAGAISLLSLQVLILLLKEAQPEYFDVPFFIYNSAVGLAMVVLGLLLIIYFADQLEASVSFMHP